jgi:hypothetical protein
MMFTRYAPQSCLRLATASLASWAAVYRQGFT